MKKQPKKQSILTGVAGEYFVAAELSRLGYIASITLRNTKGIDILATNQKGTRSITIQCKTTQTTRKSWMLNEKCEKNSQPNHFYVFVSLGSPKKLPSFHIVPSRIVAKRVKEGHRSWSKQMKRDGTRHAYTSVRQFRDVGGEFLGKWHLLKL
jgi:hypothetical protein